MKTRLLLTFTCGLLGSALAGPSPVPGSSRPDAWARAGQSLTLTVPEVAGRTVNANGLPATIATQSVTVTIPASTPPGRLLLRFANISNNQLLTTREIEVLPQGSTPQDKKMQLMLNPNLSAAQVDQLLAKVVALGLGQVVSKETLPKAAKAVPPSPCGGAVAELELGPNVTLEQALNKLLELGGTDLWYPDPISTWGAPAVAQSQASPPTFTPTFSYAPVPVSPREALGLDKKPTKLTGKGVTIAVLDTGFSSSLDPLNELTGRVRSPLNATVPYDPVLSLQGAGDFWEGHGTQVAILAAGSKNGIAIKAEVLPIKVCSPGADGRASCNTRDVLRGLCLGLNQVPASGLVINLSLGGSTPTNAIHAVLNWATSQGAVVVAAGGNQGQRGNPREYPAAFTQGTPTQLDLPLFAVASVTPAQASGPFSLGGVMPRSLKTSAGWTYSLFSTKGTYLNVSAPGEALDIGHAYLYSGTSFAAPLVAGAAALAKSANLNAKPQVLQTAMLSGNNIRVFPGIKPLLDFKNY